MAALGVSQRFTHARRLVGGAWAGALRMYGTPAAQVEQEGKILTFEAGGRSRRFGARWLRDHCSCPECLHQETLQRQYNTRKLAGGVTVQAVEAADNGKVHLTYSDGHSAQVCLDWLARCEDSSRLGDGEEFAYAPLLNTETWSEATMQTPPIVAYNDVMGGEDGVKQWAEHIQRAGCAIVEGLPTPFDPADTRKVVERLAPTRQSFFGDFWNILVSAKEQTNLEHGDTAYTNLPLAAHTDGTYFTDPPGLQYFQIPEHSGEGGETILVDGFHIAKRLQEDFPASWAYLSQTSLHYQYYEPGVCLRTSGPIFRLTSSGKLLRYSYNNDDRAAAYVPPEDEERHYEAINDLLALLQDRSSQCRLQLQPDQLLVLNNWRVMHGRTQFTGSRRLVGCYVDMENFLSRCRLLSSTPPMEGPSRLA